MTVSYTPVVASNGGFGSFWKLLFRWKGSVYKLVWRDLLLYTLIYYALSFVYRFALNEDGRRIFEKLSIYTQNLTELIPMAFVLGFYVSVVIGRWWSQYQSLPWPDRLSVYLSTFISGQDDKGRMMRRTIVRYANLAFILTFTMISPKAKKRFPTLEHLVEAGILTLGEKKILEGTVTSYNYSIYWMPLVWAGTIVSRARKEGRIRDDFAVKTLIDELNGLRGNCGTLLSYDWISIPLVYTQVVTLAVYTFFLSTLLGRQFLDPSKQYKNFEIDFYIPVFTFLQFFFYMGWLKVAETLVNPFGEDDDDFEINYLIDRNVKVSYIIVDEMHNDHPDLVQDIYWDQVFPQELPYTVASEDDRPNIPLGSTANIEVPLEKQEILPAITEERPKDENTDGLAEEGRASSGLGKKASVVNFSSFFGRKSSVSATSRDRLGVSKSVPSCSGRRESLRNIASNLSGIVVNIGRKASCTKTDTVVTTVYTDLTETTELK